MIITENTFDCLADLDLAKTVGDTLAKAYPGWLFAVEIKDHCPLIRLLNAPIQGYCMFIHRKDILTSSDFKKKIVMSGGELLERCGAKRGSMTESSIITKVDGVEDRFYTIPKSMRQ